MRKTLWRKSCQTFVCSVCLCVFLNCWKAEPLLSWPMQIQEDEPTAFVTYEKFEKKMLEVLETQEFAPDTEDVLLQAFRVRPVVPTCMSAFL